MKSLSGVLPSPKIPSGLVALVLFALLVPCLMPSAQAENFEGAETRFSPDQGEPIFPAGNLNVFKQYVVTIDESERVGKTTRIDLLFDTFEFGGELKASVNAAFGIEVGLCFGGNADFELGFKPTITLPDRYPSEIPIPLTVTEGLLPDSNFTTTFPPLGKAYADLVFDLGAKLTAKACVFGCVSLPFDLSTCDIPPLPSGDRLFKVSTRCDPTLDAEAFCSVELASFNRNDDTKLRLLNVAAENAAEFLAEPYKEFAPSTRASKTFTADPVEDTLQVSLVLPLVDGVAVKISSSGTLPGGLVASTPYVVTNTTGRTLQLASSAGGSIVDITSEGTGTHTVSLVEEVEPLGGKYGVLSLGIPTVATDSTGSPYNTAQVLKSSGAEDIIGIGIDVAALSRDVLIPPFLPALADSGSEGAISWSYSLASLSLGPAVQLQTEFEMTWDLEVTRITLSGEVKVDGFNVTEFRDGLWWLGDEEVTNSPKTYHLTNIGPNRLPAIEMLTADPPLPVDVVITYVLKPKLKTVVSLPVTGHFNYAAARAGASISRVGSLGFGPLIEGAHKFKFGEFKVFDGDPSPISGGGDEGTIAFRMQAAGPPSFSWTPDQLGGGSTGDWSQLLVLGNETLSNWLELLSGVIKNAIPGVGNVSSDVQIDRDVSPSPTLFDSLEIASLKVGATQMLDLDQLNLNLPPELTVGGGLVDNSGTIHVKGGSSLKLNSPEAVLCGPGTVSLSEGSSIVGHPGPGALTFCNYNVIRGVGLAMDVANPPDSTSSEITRPSTINNLGTFRAEGGGNELLVTSADTILNQGVFEASTDTDYSVFGVRLDSRVGSRIAAEGGGAQTFLSFDEVDHAGLIRTSQGGLVSVGPWSVVADARATWNAGQSFTDDVGFFRALDEGSFLQFERIDLNGGCVVVAGGSTLEAIDSNFTGTVFHIGDFDESGVDAASGLLTLEGANQKLHEACLTSWGTVRVPGQAEFIDSVIFANNGTVEVPRGGVLRIHEKTIKTPAPGAPESARTQPGTANATGDTLIGGTWDVGGTLLIDGAAFTTIGANAARASTRRASRDELGVERGADEDDLSRVLSLGDPATVRLRGTGASFPALDTLEKNGGSLQLLDGAAFPAGAPAASTPGDFTNRGDVFVDDGGQLAVGGSYIQSGAKTTTEIRGSGALTSDTQSFHILGGMVSVDAASNFFNRTAGQSTIASGTTIRVESPLIDTNETDISGNPVFVQERVVVDVAGEITTIAQGAALTIHGGAIDFTAIRDSLAANAGTFTLSGDGIDNAPRIRLGFTGDVFSNTGQVNVLGYTTSFGVSEYRQSGASASTRIGAGATLVGNVEIFDGEIVLEIAARPREGQFAQINASSSAAFGGGLVIEFTGALAEDDRAGSVDIGDTWEIMPRTSSANITGLDGVRFIRDGAPLPPDWLPAGSSLALIEFDTDFGKRGLGVRVVPDAGYEVYFAWAADSGLDTSGFLANPFQDADDNGLTNGEEFLFGPDGPDGVATVEVVVGDDGESRVELTYLRPSGAKHRDATYTPYFSRDRVNWYVAPMYVKDRSPVPGEPLERVTLESIFPLTTEGVFFRIQADFNPDSFEEGVIPQKPLQGRGGLENLGYQPGQVLFFNIPTASNEDQNSLFGTGIYRDSSPLNAAVAHAGVLALGDNGVVKVTILPAQVSYTGSTQNGVTSQTFPGPENRPDHVSYRIDSVEVLVAEAGEPAPIESFDLDVTKAGTGSGTVTSEQAGIFCGDDCSELYRAGTRVVLTPRPDEDSVFAGWSGDADCSDGELTMDGDHSCTATFNLKTDPGPGPGPGDLVTSISDLIVLFRQEFSVASADLNPTGDRKDPIQKALDKARKALTAVEKKAAKGQATKALLAFAKVAKGLSKSPQDVTGRFAVPFAELEDLVQADAESMVAAIDASRQAIQNLGAPLSAKLEAKYDAAKRTNQTLQTLSSTDRAYYKVLKRVKFDKVLKSYDKAATKARKKLGSG